MRLILTLCFFIAFCSYTHAQDIVYLKNGKTLGGLITLRGEEHIRFRNSITNKGERIENHEIERYYRGSEKSYYYPKLIPEKYLHFGAASSVYFVKQIVAGKINIYLFEYNGADIVFPNASGSFNGVTNRFHNDVKQHFIEKDDSGLKAIEFDLFTEEADKKATQDLVSGFLSDNPELAAAFRAEKRKVKTVIKYANAYNDWVKAQPIN